MVKFHISDDGKARRCRAREMERCQFYSPEDPRHYGTETEAQGAAEEWSRRKAEEDGHGTTETHSRRKRSTEEGPDDSAGGAPDVPTDTWSFDVPANYADMDREERSLAMQQTLDEAVERIVSDGNFGQFLANQARNGMNRWSASNAIIAASQLMDYRARNGLPNTDIFTTMNEMHALGAKEWKTKHNRFPASGKGSALYILAPYKVSRDVTDSSGKPVLDKDGNPKKNEWMMFRPVPVFDISQTKGDPVATNPATIAPITQEIDDRYVDSMKEAIATSGFTFRYENSATNPEKLEGVLGSTSPRDKTVRVDPRLPKSQQAAVIAHELAHIKMGHVTEEGLEEYQSHRGRMETEAEGLAFMLMQRAGLNQDEGKSFSPGYIAGWSKGDMTVVRKALNSVTGRFNKLMQEMGWDS